MGGIIFIQIALLFLSFYVLPTIFVWKIRTTRRWLGVLSVLLLSWPGYLLFRFARPAEPPEVRPVT